MIYKSIFALILLLVLFPSSSVAQQIITIPFGGTYSYPMNITATYSYNIEIQNLGLISVCVNSQENCNNGQYLAVDTYFSVIGSIQNSGNNFLNVVNGNAFGSVDISFSISYVTPAQTAATTAIIIIVVIAIIACCCLCCCLCLVALVLFIVYMTVGIGKNIAGPTATTKTSTNATITTQI